MSQPVTWERRHEAFKALWTGRDDLVIASIDVVASGAGDTELVAAQSGKLVKVYNLQYESNADIDVSLRFAAGTKWARRMTKGVFVQSFTQPQAGGESQALNLRVEGAVTVRGSVAYVQE